jgi:hypothetical protein
VCLVRAHSRSCRIRALLVIDLGNHSKSPSFHEDVQHRLLSDECGSLDSGHSQEMVIHKTMNQEATCEHKKRPSKSLRLG